MIAHNAPLLLVNPAHGNEPYLLGTDIALEVSAILKAQGHAEPAIIVPLLYGERQASIMKEEFGSRTSVFFDETFGDILKHLLFSKEGYSSHLDSLVQNYSTTAKKIATHFSTSLECTSLTGEQCTLDGKIIGSIDIGARILVPAPRRYFCFPVLLSELMQETISAQEHEKIFAFNFAHLRTIQERMQAIEAQYSAIFVPQLSTFSYHRGYPYKELITEYRGKTLTPPLKHPSSITSGMVQKKGVYLMFSGTEIDVEQNMAIFESAWNSNLEVYIPPWVTLEGMTEGEDYFKAPPSAITDENIIAIAGRSGWGSGWLAETTGKPWLVSPYQQEDDPEIFFNNKTVESMFIGQVIDYDSYDPRWDLNQTIKSLGGWLRSQIKAGQNPVFDDMDGIKYTARKIAEDLRNNA